MATDMRNSIYLNKSSRKIEISRSIFQRGTRSVLKEIVNIPGVTLDYISKDTEISKRTLSDILNQRRSGYGHYWVRRNILELGYKLKLRGWIK